MDSHRYYQAYASSITEIPSLIEKARADRDSCKARIDAIELEMLASVSLCQVHNCHPGHMEELEAFIDANSSRLATKRALQAALQGYAAMVSELEAVTANPAYAVHMQEALEEERRNELALRLKELERQEMEAAVGKWAEVKDAAILKLQEKGLTTDSKLKYYEFTRIDSRSIVEGEWVAREYRQPTGRQYTVTEAGPAYILAESNVSLLNERHGRYFYVWAYGAFVTYGPDEG